MNFPGDVYQEFVFQRTYARWNGTRREFWDETVNRYKQFMLEVLDQHSAPIDFKRMFSDACQLILKLEIVPSMRALWTAGKALEIENVAGYNCSYLPINSIDSFAELLYLLMNGVGVGFSVERREIDCLPPVPHEFIKGQKEIVFDDSKLGWARGFKQFIRSLYAGVIPPYNLSKIRPRGAPLRTFGGRASGPEPLQDLLEWTTALFVGAAGRFLKAIEYHDLCCKIASVVMVGGVRRSACISLSDLDNYDMARAKSGEWWTKAPYRQFANNSAVYTQQPSAGQFLGEFVNLIESKSGERGIFNRQAAEFSAAKANRRTGFRWGCNPCGEIILRPMGLCNLSEVIVRPKDTRNDIRTKVRYATVLGIAQSLLTKFRFLRPDWSRNCIEERLLGVSLTGLMDHNDWSQAGYMMEHGHALKYEAHEVANWAAQQLHISTPTAITCIKPSGTVSQLAGCSSGLHARFAPYYIRRVQVMAVDPMAKFLIDAGVPHIPAPSEMDQKNPSAWAFEFPIAAKSAVYQKDMHAIDQCRYWYAAKMAYTDHNPSCTISVRDWEWPEVAAWVWQYWPSICGMAFLSADDNVYYKPPYEEISEDQYEELVAKFPKSIDFSKLSQYERDDQTSGSVEYACGAGGCDL